MSKKISQLPSVVSMQDTDLLTLVRGGLNYKIDYEDFKSDTFSKVSRTVFVDSTYGDNSTGEVENPGKPFLTIAGAHVASAAYWTGGTAPTSTNMINFIIKGTFTESVTMLNYHRYNISGSIVTGQWIDNGANINSVIYGSGIIFNTSGNVVGLTGSSSTLTIDVDQTIGRFVSTGANSIYVSSKSSAALSDNLVNIQAGTIIFYNCYSLSSSTQPLCLTGPAGTIKFLNCTMVSDKEIITTNTATTATIIVIEGCTLKTTGTNYDTINLLTNTGTNVTLTIKDSTLIANGTGNSIDAAQATNVQIQGSCQTNLTHDTGNVTLLGGTVANGRFLISTDITL